MDSEERSTRSCIVSNKPYELLIPGYPKGSDITILNATYIPSIKNQDNKYDQDYIMILFKNNETGTKHTHIIFEPLYTFYFNPRKDYTYNLFFMPKESLVPVTCKYVNIRKAIAESLGQLQEFHENIANGMSKDNQKFHANPNVFMSDMHIEHYYRFLFGQSYTNNVFKLSKSFLDIETDIKYCGNQFPEKGQVPINAIAYCDEAHNTVYQFLYNDPNNPLVEQYRQLCQNPSLIAELKQFVINAVGGYKKAVKFGVDKLEYRLVFFDNELEMISKMFELIKLTAPDFIECWNMAFDLDYMVNRIANLLADTEDAIEKQFDIICDNRIPIRFFNYYIDEINMNLYEERGDNVSISSYTVWLDQMIEFASRRKGRARYQSFKLDAIGEDVAGVRKLDYSHITNNIGDLPYLDMKTFSFYNIMDVIVQKCIEHCTQDLEYVFTKCLVNNTSYAKCHRQSIYLSNRFAKDFYNYGYIIGNNKNKWNEKPTTKFPGAMVGDPLHNSEKPMVHINGKSTLLADNVIDFDYSSLYPSIILENNLAPNTQIGKILIEDPTNPSKTFSLEEHQDMYSSSDEIARYSRGGEFLENLMCNNPLEFGRRWMRLGDIHQVIEDMREYYQFNGYTGMPIDNDEIVYFVKDSMVDVVTIEDGQYMISKQVLTFDAPLTNERRDNLRQDIMKDSLL